MGTLASLIKKCRSIVKIFKNSPVKNDKFLQKHVREEFHHELNLILDSKTRWSSLHDSLERILKLEKCIRKALIEMGSTITLTDTDIILLKEVVNTLGPAKKAVEALCR